MGRPQLKVPLKLKITQTTLPSGSRLRNVTRCGLLATRAWLPSPSQISDSPSIPAQQGASVAERPWGSAPLCQDRQGDLGEGPGALVLISGVRGCWTDQHLGRWDPSLLPQKERHSICPRAHLGCWRRMKAEGRELTSSAWAQEVGWLQGSRGRRRSLSAEWRGGLRPPCAPPQPPAQPHPGVSASFPPSHLLDSLMLSRNMAL